MAHLRTLDFSRLRPIGRRGWLIRTAGYTTREVRDLLRSGASTERGRAVSRCAARPGDWLPTHPDLIHCPTHFWERLPRIVFWHARGESPAQIVRRIGGSNTTWNLERALNTACLRMAVCLNRQPSAYGYNPRDGSG